jgi:phosphomannomutase
MEELLGKIYYYKPKRVAIANDGSNFVYPFFNLLESNLLAIGIDVIDCNVCTASIISSSIKKIEADIGIFLYQENSNIKYLIFNNKGIPLFIGSIDKSYQIKEWKEIGNIINFDILDIYKNKILKLFEEKEEKIDHIVLNLNFSPLSKILPYITRMFSKRVTTLNSSETQTINISFEESLQISNELLKAYNANLALTVDRLGERFNLQDMNGEVLDVLERAISAITLGRNNIKKIYVLGERSLSLNSSIQTIRIKKLQEISFDENILVVDTHRNSLIYPDISWWFDPLVTFIFWYKDRFIYKKQQTKL